MFLPWSSSRSMRYPSLRASFGVPSRPVGGNAPHRPVAPFGLSLTARFFSFDNPACRQHHPARPSPRAAFFRSKQRSNVPHARSPGLDVRVLLPRWVIPGPSRRQIWRQVAGVARVRDTLASRTYPCVFSVRHLRSPEWSHRLACGPELDRHPWVSLPCFRQC